MKIVKISSLGCPSCIIMNNVINKVRNEYDIDIKELDYDFDDVEKYNPGKILPVLIFYKNDNVKRAIQWSSCCGAVG